MGVNWKGKKGKGEKVLRKAGLFIIIIIPHVNIVEKLNLEGPPTWLFHTYLSFCCYPSTLTLMRLVSPQTGLPPMLQAVQD